MERAQEHRGGSSPVVASSWGAKPGAQRRSNRGDPIFTRLSGILLDREPELVRIECGGLTYDVVVPPSVGAKIDALAGGALTLEIFAQLTIDGSAARFTFFGFTNAIERAFFEALLSVAGIGPRAAARAFSAPMARIAQAIDAGDHVFLKTLPGIGQQKARDIVAKLQGKVGRFLLIQDAPARPSIPAAIPAFGDEALAVLLQLAYRRPEAEAMIAETLAASPHVRDAETLLAEIYNLRRRSDES